ncbi:MULTISPECIES: DinI-like family protein [Providencia]|uniref:DinI-like family protein n=3 Tax=Providencia rustigianii TaxID=158850 RepID=D1P5G6_9GAMM|nr:MULTISPECIES: DinI-like family protein [Providencia]EFB71290.1 DinI-like family protein [Providencia rustigianii DSM 4541]MTC57810.1 DinI-like family protein [Providencia rustigianii]MTC59433.1 DinI-like family protein [Providencia rustigianii]SPY77933.1 DNA damage-inducible protein I [Providencia rustigianii]SUC27470.1 DNA damage-inducible protein I [Providencia rustigianii]
MLRIEVLFDKNAAQKPSNQVLQALESEILRKLQSQYPDIVTRVGFSSQQAVNISGTKIAEDKVRIQEILEEIWMDDGWLPEENIEN